MSVKLHFGDSPSVIQIAKQLWPDESGNAINESPESASISRHDIILEKSGRHTLVKINGVDKSELSQATIDSIKQKLPADFIRLEDG